MQSALGIGAIILTAWVMSENRRAFPWRTVIVGLALQIALALLLLKIPLARAALFSLNGVVDALIEEIDKWEVEERAGGTLPAEKRVETGGKVRLPVLS